MDELRKARQLSLYMIEAKAIANEQRKLDERFKRLLEIVYSESPELIKAPTDFHPQLTGSPGNSSPLARNTVEYFIEYLSTP